MRERETKLSPPPGFRIPDLQDLTPEPDGTPLTAIEVDPLLLQTTYYDTGDLRLARAGASLRYRNHDGWTVKLPGIVVDGMLVRGEHRVEGGAGAPPDAAVDLVRAHLRTARIAPVARLRTRRVRIQLVDAEGKLQAELVDDEVSVLDGRRVATRFRELEVELVEAASTDVAAAIVDRLRAHGAGDPDPTPKSVRALGPRALRPPDVPAPDPTTAITAGDVVRNAIADSVRRLVAHDAGVRLGDDPEFVHQARVATRRLRSDLRTFRSLLDPVWASGLREELQWLGAELGAVRDTDVLLELLRAKVTGLPAADRPGADTLLTTLVARWEAQRIELLRSMRTPRYAVLLDRLVEAAVEPQLVSDFASESAAVLSALMAGPWSHLRRAVEELGDDPTDASLHEVRIRAKRCRYASEALAPVVGKPARDFAKQVAVLQTVLGDHHDAIVAGAWLRGAAATAAPPEAFAAGELAAATRVEELAARDEWSAAWSRARRKSLRRWW